ncbi:MAG: glycosyltransferase family 2 protein [Gammaproteobacteria bacterium]|nr:glycosyltransferase family 2 protein [Gammaproteobacteria bacterium]
MRTIKFSIVIPCFNEESSILETVQQIHDLIADWPDCEIIVVNDGSTDTTTEKLASASAEYGNLTVINEPNNRGYGASLKDGIQEAKGEYIAITDADGSYPNEKLEEMFATIADSKADMVVGARTADDVVYSKLRSIPKYFFRKYCSWIANYDIPDINSGLRVFKRAVYSNYVNIIPDGFSFTTTVTLAFLTNNHKVIYLPIGYKDRAGKSKIRPIRDTLMFVQLIVRTGMYFAPLKVFLPIALTGFAGGAMSFLYDLIYLDNLTDKTVILLMFSLNFGMFALLADMIDKRR